MRWGESARRYASPGEHACFHGLARIVSSTGKKKQIISLSLRDAFPMIVDTVQASRTKKEKKSRWVDCRLHGVPSMGACAQSRRDAPHGDLAGRESGGVSDAGHCFRCSVGSERSGGIRTLVGGRVMEEKGKRVLFDEKQKKKMKIFNLRNLFMIFG